MVIFISIAGVVILLGLFLYLAVAPGVTLGPHTDLDSRRISDLHGAENALALYFNKCGYFPGGIQPNATCSSFSRISTWSDLTRAIEGSKLDLGDFSLPNDPVKDKTYFYGTDTSGSSYVLGALLDNVNHYYLAYSEATGTLYGVNCNAPMFCMVHASTSTIR